MKRIALAAFALALASMPVAASAAGQMVPVQAEAHIAPNSSGLELGFHALSFNGAVGYEPTYGQTPLQPDGTPFPQQFTVNSDGSYSVYASATPLKAHAPDDERFHLNMEMDMDTRYAIGYGLTAQPQQIASSSAANGPTHTLAFKLDPASEPGFEATTFASTITFSFTGL